VVELLRQAVPATVLVVAVDPGKVCNRVWLTSGERGLIGRPVSLPVLREGIDRLAGLIAASGVAGPPRIAVEATGRRCCIERSPRPSAPTSALRRQIIGTVE
jgi:hypothetical protein